MNIPEITLRDYFAAQVIGAFTFNILHGRAYYVSPSDPSYRVLWEDAAQLAYQAADALLQARQQEEAVP